MLQISNQTAFSLETASWPQFVERLREGLAETYGEILGAFGPVEQTIIVENMLGRAHYWGVSNQDSYLAFCEFMLEIAPNFDQHEAFQKALSQADELIDDIVMELPETLSAEAWGEAEEASQDLALFVPAHLIEAPLTERTLIALAFLLPDQSDRWEALLRRAEKDAKQLRIDSLDDAMLALAVWDNAFGNDRFNEGQHPWVQDLKDFSISAPVRVAQLKFQIALDLKMYV